jgi:hypothetical protein
MKVRSADVAGRVSLCPRYQGPRPNSSRILIWWGELPIRRCAPAFINVWICHPDACGNFLGCAFSQLACEYEALLRSRFTR